MKYTKIDGYEMKVIDSKIHYYACIGKERIEMPEYYKDMYDNKHLAITKRVLTYPEVFDIAEEEHYIPLSTEVYQCQKKSRKPTPQ